MAALNPTYVGYLTHWDPITLQLPNGYNHSLN